MDDKRDEDDESGFRLPWRAKDHQGWKGQILWIHVSHNQTDTGKAGGMKGGYEERERERRKTTGVKIRNPGMQAVHIYHLANLGSTHKHTHIIHHTSHVIPADKRKCVDAFSFQLACYVGPAPFSPSNVSEAPKSR